MLAPICVGRRNRGRAGFGNAGFYRCAGSGDGDRRYVRVGEEVGGKGGGCRSAIRGGDLDRRGKGFSTASAPSGERWVQTPVRTVGTTTFGIEVARRDSFPCPAFTRWRLVQPVAVRAYVGSERLQTLWWAASSPETTSLYMATFFQLELMVISGCPMSGLHRKAARGGRAARQPPA